MKGTGRFLLLVICLTDVIASNKDEDSSLEEIDASDIDTGLGLRRQRSQRDSPLASNKDKKRAFEEIDESDIGIGLGLQRQKSGSSSVRDSRSRSGSESEEQSGRGTPVTELKLKKITNVTDCFEEFMTKGEVLNTCESFFTQETEYQNKSYQAFYNQRGKYVYAVGTSDVLKRPIHNRPIAHIMFNVVEDDPDEWLEHVITKYTWIDIFNGDYCHKIGELLQYPRVGDWEPKLYRAKDLETPLNECKETDFDNMMLVRFSTKVYQVSQQAAYSTSYKCWLTTEKGYDFGAGLGGLF